MSTYSQIFTNQQCCRVANTRCDRKTRERVEVRSGPGISQTFFTGRALTVQGIPEFSNVPTSGEIPFTEAYDAEYQNIFTIASLVPTNTNYGRILVGEPGVYVVNVDVNVTQSVSTPGYVSLNVARVGQLGVDVVQVKILQDASLLASPVSMSTKLRLGAGDIVFLSTLSASQYSSYSTITFTRN